ncbi:hypothetical protein BZB76_0982 [Actinomadura pelletieri DSM 43383]|uniref:Uncharacterized protein n=1 Tax=Actinomadura pelletieri DSM 43383 TaxID=1120940 RepID=A0A495QZ68_9ACTN|nr:hypothetical protein [Actinomadura pelletieri]RKS79511.1 hypothetical protein BZB76_0982 [Actinomadura pelletieri DSM 43383]
MSWDVLLMRVPAEVRGMDDLPQDYAPEPVGSLPDALGRLASELPEVDLSDPEWGVLEGPTWSIELNIGHDDPLEAVMLHVRGGGDDVLTVILRIAQILGCRALDTSTGDFLAEGRTEGWHAFQQYRDQVANRLG